MRGKWLEMLMVVPILALLVGQSLETNQSIISAAYKIASAIVLTFGITLHMIVATILWFVVVIKARRLGCDPAQGPYREGQKVLACVRGHLVQATVMVAPWQCPVMKLRFDIPGGTVTVWWLDVGVTHCDREAGSADD